MPKTQDVLIVGGGAVGAACARELAVAGRSVTVLEPGDRGGAAWLASAGLLAPQIESGEDHPLFELGIAGREYYRDRSPALAEETGVDLGLFDAGILRLAHGEAEVDRLKSSVAWQRQHGHPTEWLDPTELASEYPWVGPSDGALRAPHDGAIDPVRLVDALRKSAVGHGARFVADAAVELELEQGRVAAVRGEKGRYHGDQVVLAAGAWTGRLAGLPRPVSVEPVRGQMVAKSWPPGTPPAIVFGSGGYVLHRGGEAHCGATMEHAGFLPAVTPEGIARVAAAADSLIPALGSLPVLRSWAGLRPGTPDGLPIVGREPSVENLWYATGYGRNGILLAGISALALTHMFGGEATFEGIEALRPDRFWSW